mmetsp:Transcript_137744/g.239512  ORF Transcript_137744/g.239512 Transcript_137744/m.239512 type:complete len:217 (-) Transcript_137744:2766-3416(-)
MEQAATGGDAPPQGLDHDNHLYLVRLMRTAPEPCLLPAHVPPPHALQDDCSSGAVCVLPSGKAFPLLVDVLRLSVQALSLLFQPQGLRKLCTAVPDDLVLPRQLLRFPDQLRLASLTRQRCQPQHLLLLFRYPGGRVFCSPPLLPPALRRPVGELHFELLPLCLQRLLLLLSCSPECFQPLLLPFCLLLDCRHLRLLGLGPDAQAVRVLGFLLHGL